MLPAWFPEFLRLRLVLESAHPSHGGTRAQFRAAAEAWDDFLYWVVQQPDPLPLPEALPDLPAPAVASGTTLARPCHCGCGREVTGRTNRRYYSNTCKVRVQNRRAREKQPPLHIVKSA